MSAVYILDSKGRVLISFDYRGEVDFSIPDKFMAYIQANDKIQPPPVFRVDDWTFVFIERAAMFFFMVTRANTNVASLLVFLDGLATLFSSYLEVDLSADAIIDNFSLIYELLDEVMDYGYPQTVDMQALAAYILREKPKNLKDQPKEVPLVATGLVTWRPEGISYNVNEVFVDVSEHVNLLVGTNNAIIQNEVVGEINLTTYLSGMPEVQVGLNDKILFDQADDRRQTDVTRRVFELEDIKFHQCVRLSQYELDHVITFIPPDGRFCLLRYRVSAAIRPIINITSTVERFKGSRVELVIQARGDFTPQSVAQDVSIKIPVPTDADSPKAKCTVGKMKYTPKDNQLVWTIRKFPGGKQFSMKAHFGLPSVESEDEDSKRPISVDFEIPYFTLSGLQVQYLKVFEKTGYECVNWVRYVTCAGTYEFRQ
jgi:AP-1 complex subunit mu